MDSATANAIAERANNFTAELRSGNLDWTAEELASFFLEPKKDASRITVRELNLGPIDVARSGLVARVVAAMLNIHVESAQVTRDGKKVAGYVFEVPPEKAVGLPQVVERRVEVIKEVPVRVEVEKVVYRDREPAAAQRPPQDLEVPIVFAGEPLKLERNTKFSPPEWYARMEAALNSGRHVSLGGPPGGGKSTAPEEYFARKGQPCVVINGDAGFRRRDMEGGVEVQSGSTFFRVAEFATAAVRGWGVILNEVNAADADALLFINGILEVPHVVNIHGKAYPVHKDFRMVVTYNPGLVGTKALPQAFKDRFFSIKLGFPSREFLKKLMLAKGMPAHAHYASVFLDFAEAAFAEHIKGTLRYQLSPRRLFDAVFLMETMPGMRTSEAVLSAVVEAVDSPTDVEVLKRLVREKMR